MVRDEGGQLNTHFRAFQAPMGLALDGDRLAVGTDDPGPGVRNMPAVTAKLEPPGRHDACFLPRASHVTGNIQVHEMAWDRRASSGSSTPGSPASARSTARQLRPALAAAVRLGAGAEDRCHLNGLGMVDGRPRYVTALGETDAPAGWRANKARGGVLMDVASGE